MLRPVERVEHQGKGRGKGEKVADDPVLRGARTCTLPRANHTYPVGRVCASETCTTVLSVYNEWQLCWQHEPLHGYSARGHALRTQRPTAILRAVASADIERRDSEFLAAAG